MNRRAFLAGSAAAASVLALGRGAGALGRTKLGGTVKLHMPWPLATIDPHRLDDIGAAVLGEALFDTLYARQEGGAFGPSLAESEPVPDGDALRVVVRSGLATAHGRAIDARDAMSSLARARAAGALAWLSSIGQPRLAGTDTLVFAGRDPERLMRALASPLTAIVPIGFRPSLPDGTGPMRASRQGDALVLVRNGNAARGASFLDQMFVREAGGLDVSLRAFETGADDIGWLGSGYFDTRADSRPFDAGAIGWAILCTGREAGPGWDAPGVAQSVADSLPPSELGSFFLGPPWATSGVHGWGGPSCDLLVREDAPWLVELAKTVAATLSSGNAVTARAVSPSEMTQRRAARAYTLAMDVARPLLHGALGAFAGLATADDPKAAVEALRYPPRGGDMSPRALTRTMHLGVVGEIRVQGGRVPDLSLPVSTASFGIDFGAATRSR